MIHLLQTHRNVLPYLSGLVCLFAIYVAVIRAGSVTYAQHKAEQAYNADIHLVGRTQVHE